MEVNFLCFFELANIPSDMEVKLAKLLLTDSSGLILPNFGKVQFWHSYVVVYAECVMWEDQTNHCPYRRTLRFDTIFGIWKPFIMMKIAFYFTSKSLFVLKVFKFLSWIFSIVRLIRKIRLILKFIMSQPGKKTIALNILPNISRSKGDQTIKFRQLIEYNMRHIFLEKSWTKRGGETILRPFSKKLELSIPLDQ